MNKNTSNNLRDIAADLEDKKYDIDEVGVLIQVADGIDRLRADLAYANDRLTFWMDAHKKDCAGLQEVRDHLLADLAQRNEELLQTKAEAARYREGLNRIARGEYNYQYPASMIAEDTLKGGE